MKIIILSYLSMSLMLASCGGSDSGGGDAGSSTGSPTNTLSLMRYYVGRFENTGVNFKSQSIAGYALSEVDNDEIVVIRGDLNEYGTNKDGTPRSGVHLPDNFLYRYAVYKMNRVNGKVIYTFDRGSCGNINPFSQTFLEEGKALSLPVEGSELKIEFIDNEFVTIPKSERFSEVIDADESEVDLCIAEREE